MMIAGLAMVMVFVSAGGADAARHGVWHVTGAGMVADLTTCEAVADGEPCSFTELYATNERPTSIAFYPSAGPCVLLEHWEGYRVGPNVMQVTSSQTGKACGTMRITIPRSLGWAHVVGTLQTQTCGWLSPDPCSDAVISIDLTWHATGPVQSTPPSTVRFAGDDSDPSCLTHLGRFTSRPATVSGSIPELGPLGDVLAGRAGIGTDSFTYVGDANSCPD